MEKPPKNLEKKLGDIFADRTIPRIIEKDTSTGNVVEVLTHNEQILMRVEGGTDNSVRYSIDGKELSTT
jgi:hypothetical protein